MIRLLVLGLVISATGLATVTAAEPPMFEELLVEVRAGQLARTTVMGYHDGMHMLLPVAPTFDLLEIQSQVDTTGVLLATDDAREFSLRLDATARTAWINELPRVLDAPWQLVDAGQLFVEAELLAELIGVPIHVSFADLTAVFDPVDELPVGRRLARQFQRRSLVSGAAAPADLTFDVRRSWWRGATVDWSLSVPNLSQEGATSGSLSLGGNVLGGGLDLHARHQFGGSSSSLDGTWLGVWPEDPWLKQVQLGRATTTSPRPRSTRGVAMTNSPYVRPLDFGQRRIRGTLAPDWEVEVHAYGQIVAYGRTDARGYYEFEVPLDYGSNAVEVRAYGPHGEVRIFEDAMRVGFDRIPAEALEYGASAGDCPDDDCQGTMNLDLRYGLNSNWTVRGGTDAFFRGAEGDLVHPYATVAGSLGSSWTVRYESILNALQGLRLGFEPSSNLRTSWDGQWYDRSATQPILTRTGESSLLRGSVFWRPWPSRRSLFVQASGSNLGSRLGDTTTSTLSVTSRIGGVRSTLTLREQWFRAGAFESRSSSLEFNANLVLGKGFGPLRQLFVRSFGQIDTGVGSRDLAGMSVGRTFARTARIEVGALWYRTDERPSFTVAVSNTAASVHSTASVTRATNGTYDSYTTGEGSLRWNGLAGQIEAHPFRSLGRGGVRGTLYVDANANGRRDRDELPVPRARLFVGGQVASTDELGQFSVWNLTPFIETRVEIDPSSLENPMLVPDFEVAAIEVPPNGYGDLDLPVLEGREVEGRVELTNGAALGGVSLRLVDRDSDRSFSVRTFHDGEFYLLSVPPGSYDVELDPQYLVRHGLAIEDSGPVDIGLKDAPGRLVVRLLRGE